MKTLFALCLLFFACTVLGRAQEGKRVVAVMPFTSSAKENRERAGQLQEVAVQILSEKSTIEVVDRSKDSMVMKELNNQIREVSLNAKTLAAQGKLSGAQDIIVGTLTTVSTDVVKPSEKGLLNKKILGKLTTSKGKYVATISYSLQLVDVATGIVKKQKTFKGNTDKEEAANKVIGGASSLLMADTKEEAILLAIKSSRGQIGDWMNELYPIDVRILKVESRTKKGAPETVLIAGLGNVQNKGTVLIVNQIEMLDGGNGKKLKQVKKIGELKVQELQGEVTLCSVKEGAEAIEQKMKSGAKFEFTVK